MPTPIIRSSGTTSGVVTGDDRNNLVVGETVTLTDTQAANSGASYQWLLENRPIGSSTAITNPTSATASFIPDVTGTYRIRCTVNGVSYDLAHLAVPLPTTGARIPSFGEDDVGGYTVGGVSFGWHESQTTWMRAVDERLALVSFPGYGVAGNFSSIEVGDGASGGVLATVARADHQHALTAPSLVNDVSASASSLGSSGSPARSDHSHFHGNLTGGGLHALATTGAHGFMSSSDKAATVLTVSAEASLANSRRLLAGTNVTFDTTVAGQLTISASGGAGGYATIERPNGTAVTQRTILAFSTTFTATDNVDTTDIALASGGITNTLFRDSSALSIVGRSANSTGSVADISATAASGAVLRESGSTLGWGTIATGGIGDAQVTVAKLADLAGLSVLGRSTNSTGAVAAITAGTDGHVLRLSSTTLGFGQVVAAGIATGAVTATKLADTAVTPGSYTSANITVDQQGRITTASNGSGGVSAYDTIQNNGSSVTQRTTLNLDSFFSASDVSSKTFLTFVSNGVPFTKVERLAALSILGNENNSGLATMAAITASASSDAVLRESGGALGFGTVATAGIANAAVTYAKMQNGGARSLLGRSANSSGVLADITGSSGQFLKDNGTTLAFAALAGTDLTGFTDTTLPVANSSGQLVSSAITLASNTLTHAAASSGGTVSYRVANTSNTSSSVASILIETGGSSAGDPFYRWKRGTVEGIFGYRSSNTTWQFTDASSYSSTTPFLSVGRNSTGIGVGVGVEALVSSARDVFEFKSTHASAPARIQISNSSGGGTQFRAEGVGDDYIVFHRNFAGAWAVGLDDSVTNDPLVISFNDNSGGEASLGTNDHTSFDRNGNLILGTAALATSATNGFLYIPSCPGTPSGTPTSYTGRAPLVWDSTNLKLMLYSGGSWHPCAPGA